MKRIIYLSLLTSVAFSCSEKEKIAVATTEPEKVEEVPETTKINERASGIHCTGEIAVPTEARVSIHTPINGILHTVKILEGEHVKKGQLLATLEHIDIVRIQENYLKSKAQFEFWEQEFKRKKTLFEGKAIPEKEYQSARASYEAEKANYESLKQQLAILGIPQSKLNQGALTRTIRIVSPIDGYVTNVLGNTGMFVGQDTKVFELMDDRHKHVHLKVFADDIVGVEVGDSIRFHITGTEAAFSAKVYLIGKSVGSDNTIGVHGHLEEESKHLLVGTKVVGEIVTK